MSLSKLTSTFDSILSYAYIQVCYFIYYFITKALKSKITKMSVTLYNIESTLYEKDLFAENNAFS